MTTSCIWGCPDGWHGTPKTLPEQTAPYVVYGFFAHNGRCLYIGQTSDLNGRCYQHGNRPELYHAKDVRIIAEAQTRADATRLEAEAIASLNPFGNIKRSGSNRNLTRAAIIDTLAGRLRSGVGEPSDAELSAGTHDISWFCEQVGKSRSWVLAHIDDIPHHRIGRSFRFTEAGLAQYLDQTRHEVAGYMATTGRRKTA